jgi:predicted ATP-binding protein involved in virulence
MQIKKLSLSNFKLFPDEQFVFDSKFNLIIGENGAGKTSLLDALSIALGGWAHAYIKNENNLRPIEEKEIREVQIDNSFDKSKKTCIKAEGAAQVIDRYHIKKNVYARWNRVKEEGNNDTYVHGYIKYGSNPSEYNLNFGTLGSDILSYIERGQDFTLPLIAYYECDRLWQPENELNLASSAKAKYSRFDPYVDCFHTGADHQAVGEWILKHELASTQQNKETPVLSSIKAAASAALEGCKGLKFDFEKSRIMLEFQEGNYIPFEHLSDGQRTMLGLFCDLARRAAILNPHLEGEASKQTPGVVLIDELDLHLHPKWQRKIINSLKECFPLVQFFCTTHSPFLIQSLGDGKLIQLGHYSESQFVDASIEDIVEDIQGVPLPQKSKRFKDMMDAAEKYYKELNEKKNEHSENLTILQKELDNLTIPYSDDPAFAAILKIEKESVLSGASKKK